MNPSPTDFSAHFTFQKLRTIQIICAALNLGVLLFLTVILILSFTLEPIKEQGALHGTILIITGIALLGSILLYPFSVTLFNKKLQSSKSPESFEQNLVTAYALRFAILEAVAFLGLIALLLAVLDGTLFENLFYWINLLPLFFMLLVTITNFPTRSYIGQLYEVHFYFSK